MSGISNPGGPQKLVLSTVTNATSGVLPIGAVIDAITVVNSTGNIITGGLKFGTSAGATDIAAGLAVGANGNVGLAPAALLKTFFSASATQTVFIDAVTLWNSASVTITIFYNV